MGTGKNFRVCAEVCKEARWTLERLINFDPQWINDIVITGIEYFYPVLRNVVFPL